MDTKLMTTFAIITLAITGHTRAFSNSSAGFSLPLFTKHSPDRTIRRGADGFLYLQQSLISASEASAATAATILLQNGQHATEVHFGTGNGRRKLLLELDATAPLTWIQCKPCNPVATQTGPIFDGELSPTFQHVDSSVCRPPFIPDPAIRRCLFRLKGHNGLEIKGLLSVDEYTREDGHVFPKFFFGCTHETYNFHNLNTFAGILAYKRFATQAAAHGMARSSYCLFRETSRQGFLRFGAEADIPHKPRYQTTEILPANDDGDTHESEYEYHVSLASVSVGERRLAGVLPETFARRESGEGGCIIDLGTPLTVLVEEAYRVVEEAVWSELARHGVARVVQPGYGLCVRATETVKGRLPSMSLHFAGEDATLVISPKQLFLMVDDERAGQVACLAMVPGRRTVIGALQQVDTRFVFDLKDNKLSFAPESCIQDTVPVA
ncbi:unnamed protein product [Urochloa decumbens]|uniref:Peptidase A1 domain-containing protein n=1 Tax=Urochloa decumbens TaxID=240449 RepID=A0ABC9B4J5_9POAL